MITGAIFDADGTLLDSMPLWNNLGNLYLEKKGIKEHQDLSKILLSMSLEEGAEYLIKNYLFNLEKKDVINEILNMISDEYKYNIQLKKGSFNLLKDFYNNNIPVVIATATDKKLLKSALKRLKISKYIKEIFTCSELNTSKSKPDIYLHCCKFLKTKIQDTIVFEDTLVAITTAKKAGFIVAAVKDEASSFDKEKIKQNCNIYIEHFNQFILSDYIKTN